jgi:hypothetical protein
MTTFGDSGTDKFAQTDRTRGWFVCLSILRQGHQLLDDSYRIPRYRIVRTRKGIFGVIQFGMRLPCQVEAMICRRMQIKHGRVRLATG